MTMRAKGPGGAPIKHPLLVLIILAQSLLLSIFYFNRSISFGDCSPPFVNRSSREEIEFSPRPVDRVAVPPVLPIPHTRMQQLDRSKLPYKCGMVFFYHVPSTGGATINKWLLQYSNDEIAKYFTFWGRNPDGSVKPGSPKTFIEGGSGKSKLPGMNEFVTNFEPNEWRISHCHHGSLHLNISENYLTRWRSDVESQGCAFIAVVMFRDPLGHALSLYKHITRYDSSRELWNRHLETKSEQGQWQTQLDYFLYNFLARNPDGVPKETKIQRALQLLQDHFDIVTVGGHDWFRDELLKMTGWENKTMHRTNTYTKDIEFTKKEVETMQKLMDTNGDTEFMYEVKKMFVG